MGDSLDSYPGINIVSWFGEQARLAHISLNRMWKRKETQSDGCMSPSCADIQVQKSIIVDIFDTYGHKKFFYIYMILDILCQFTSSEASVVKTIPCRLSNTRQANMLNS